MTDAKQTKCPHCGSTFRITDAQLAAKGGSVRCGSCLQVFRADLHLVGAAPAAPAAAPRPAAPAAAPAPQAVTAAKPKKKGDESWALDLIGEKGEPAAAGADEFGFSDDDISNFIAKGNAAPPEASAPGKTLLFDDELSDQLEEAGGTFLGGEEATHRLSDNADESWAHDILSDIKTEEKKISSQQYSMEIVDNKNKAAPKNPKLAAAVGARPAANAPAASPAPKAAARPETRSNENFLGDDADVLSFLDEEDLTQPAGAAPAPAANPFALERPLAHVDAPVILKPRREPVRWGYFLGWGLMCLLAVALFAVQYVFFNFDRLATLPTVRPVLERTCQKFGCYVPDIPDASLIKIEELVVRKNPDVAGSLVVDAIVKNHATFPQPFPVLRLRFSNSADEIVASRNLRPAEYLRGEARMLRRMPPDTPIRISVDIVDPGKDAISYGIDPIL
ncbi:MAG TPA: DUF3426 domain-containing protein [Moraxellaceae bacterium]|nr:DUF3426 domain-containing protein [Moraxellaceae bacterium]